MVKTRRRRQKRPVAAETDYLLNAAYEQHDNLSMVYRTFAEKKPVVLFDIQEQRIYAYPCKEFFPKLFAGIGVDSIFKSNESTPIPAKSLGKNLRTNVRGEC